MLAIAVGHALWDACCSVLWLPRASRTSSLDGADVGYATLTIERITQKEPLKYSWKAELAVSGDPRLRSSESTSGKAKLGDPVLPEEVFVALVLEIGTGCRKIRGTDLTVATGQGCWTEASREHAEGTLFGTKVLVNYGPEMMPASVRYPKLGLAYRAVVAVPDELRECKRTVADDGVAAPGGAGLSSRPREDQLQGAEGTVTVERNPNDLAAGGFGGHLGGAR